MDASTHSRRPAGRRVATVAMAGLLLAAVATACSSAEDEGATPTTTIAPTSITPPTSSATATGGDRQALLSDILESHDAAGEFVGARIALRDRDGTISETAAGTTTVDLASEPVDPAVRWNIGSATKTFVAVVALQMADDGLIELDAGIEGFVPDLPGAERITPRQLLQHTSGLGEYLDQAAVQTDLRRAWTASELIAVAEAAGRQGEPGGPHLYSNTNYVVLGEIIEQVTGNSWDDEVRTRIVEPLGMTATGPVGDDRPPGYELIDGSFVDATDTGHPSTGGAAGALQSNARDLLLFATALADGTLLSPDSQTAMQTFIPAEDLSQFGIDHGYGLGLEQYSTDAITVHGHLGSGHAHSAFVGYDAETGTAVAVQMNSANPGPQALMAIETLVAVREGG